MRMVLQALVVGFLTVLSSTSFAFDFTAANDLYSHRGDSDSALEAARSKYLDVLSQLSGDDRTFALEQIARLDALAGLKLMDSNPGARVQLFQRCLDDLDQ